jgi:hypothetical protein
MRDRSERLGRLCQTPCQQFRYVNIYYDREPRLDIADAHEAFDGRLDFVIASDVLQCHTGR